MKNELVSIVVANYNGEKYLQTFLNSVLVSNYKNFELLIVDDGSTDESLKILQLFANKDKRIKIYKNEENLGAAASRNKAINQVKGDIIIFLDNDTEVTKGWLTELIKVLESKEIGAVQSLLIDFEKRASIQMGGGLLIPHVIWLKPYYQGKKYLDIKNKLECKEIVAVSAALAVKKEVLEKVGFFDNKESVYTEDLDFCWRIWIAGFKIVLSPKSIVYHYTKSVEQRVHMKSNNFQIYFHLCKNSIRSIIKNYEFKNVFKFTITTIVINLGRGLLVLIKRKDSSAILGSIMGIIWNMVNIVDILKERVKVQNTRQFSDKYLFKRIFIESNLFELYNKYFKGSKLLW